MKYLLRDIEDSLWVRVKRRAERDGNPIRFVIMKLLAYYAVHGLPKPPEKRP